MRKGLLTLALMVFLKSFSHAGIHAVGLDKTQYTSDFMIGKVAVCIIFPESNGGQDANTETWSDDRKSQVISEIMSGLDWWTKQNPRSHLSFTYITKTIATKYEPIARPYYDEALWIPDIMSKIGYTGGRFTATRNFNNALRDEYGTNWAFTIFIVDSLNDTNGKFADGLFAYAYLGGPFLVMTYDNNGYGITNMDVVAAHETGHIFNALDQYAGASSPNDFSIGYFQTINGNHSYSSTANEPSSIMRGGIRWGLDSWAKQMVGWRDSNNNNLDDLIDPQPTFQLSSSPSQSGNGNNSFSGAASVSVLPRQGNTQGKGLTLDTVSKVEYKINNNDWQQAVPADGIFDSAQESFQINIPASTTLGAQNVQASDLTLRISTFYQSNPGTSTHGGGGSPSNLNDAHAYPNPFKPNSSLGHVDITFTGLTNGSKVQVFSPAGEPVFEGIVVPASHTLQWRAINDNGTALSSGVYYYLITDDAGNKKKGKIAVIR
ncbi:MAG: hypothetical protein ACKVQC_06355 [Elusimicrobiota bacterium]